MSSPYQTNWASLGLPSGSGQNAFTAFLSKQSTPTPTQRDPGVYEPGKRRVLPRIDSNLSDEQRKAEVLRRKREIAALKRAADRVNRSTSLGYSSAERYGDALKQIGAAI